MEIWINNLVWATIYDHQPCLMPNPNRELVTRFNPFTMWKTIMNCRTGLWNLEPPFQYAFWILPSFPGYFFPGKHVTTDECQSAGGTANRSPATSPDRRSGCGMATVARYAAEHYPLSHLVAISIVEKHVAMAKELNKATPACKPNHGMPG